MTAASNAPTYADLNDMAVCGFPPNALASIPTASMARFLYQASRDVDLRLSARYSTPLPTPVGDDIVRIVCIIAGYYALVFRGFNPDDPTMSGIRMLYKDAMATLDKIAQGAYTLDALDDPPPVDVPQATSYPQRGIGRSFGCSSRNDGFE